MQNEKSLSLRSPELLPTKDSERNLSLWDYTILWAGMTINIVAFSLGAQYFNGGDGLSPWMLVLVVFLGYGLVTFLTVLAGDIGTKYGVPFAVYSFLLCRTCPLRSVLLLVWIPDVGWSQCVKYDYGNYVPVI